MCLESLISGVEQNNHKPGLDYRYIYRNLTTEGGYLSFPQYKLVVLDLWIESPVVCKCFETFTFEVGIRP